MRFEANKYRDSNFSLVQQLLASGMPFTTHEVLVERCEKYLSDLYWKDVNLFSVRYHETTAIEDMAVYEVPGTERPSFHAVVLKKKKVGVTMSHLSANSAVHGVRYEHEGTTTPAPVHVPSPIPAEPDNVPIFTPLSMRKDGRSRFGPAWSTKWFRLRFKLSKSHIRRHRNRLALRWDSQSEAMLYTSKGVAISSYTGSDGCDRRDLVYLGNYLPKVKDDAPVPRNGGKQMRDDNTSSSDSSDEGDSGDSDAQSIDGDLTSFRAAENGAEDVEITFYVEMACCGKFGNGDGGMIAPPADRTFDIKHAEVVVVNDAAMALYWDMQVLHDLAKELPPPGSGIGARAATVASTVINTTDLHSRASLLEARRLIAESGVFTATKTMMDSYTQSRSTISQFNHSESVLSHYHNSNDYKLDHHVLALGHCHIDLAWLWPYAETRRKIVRSWASQLELMERHRSPKHEGEKEIAAFGHGWHEDQEGYSEAIRHPHHTNPKSAFLHSGGTPKGHSGGTPKGPGTPGSAGGVRAESHVENWGGVTAEDRVTDMTWQFVASQAVQWEWLKEDNPELFHRVKSAVRKGLASNAPSHCFVPVGNAYTEFDANLPSGESMVRHFLYGRSFFMQEFGREEGEMDQEAQRLKRIAKEKRRHRKEKKMRAMGIPLSEYDSADDSEDSEDGEEEEDNPAVDFASRFTTPTSAGGVKRASPGGLGGRGTTTSRGTPSSARRPGSAGASTASPGNTTTPTPQANSRYTQSTAASRGRQVDNGGRGKKDHFYRPVLYEHSPVFWLPDTFGYSGNLPQIMRGFNIPYFVSQKLSWNLTEKFPHSSFVWEGIDGSGVLAHFPPADNYNCLARADEVLKSASNHSNPHDSQRSLLLFGHGDGGGGPCEEHIQHLSRLRKARGMPSVSTTESLATFFQGIEQDFHLPRTLLASSPRLLSTAGAKASESSRNLKGRKEKEEDGASPPQDSHSGQKRNIKVGVDGTIAILDKGNEGENGSKSGLIGGEAREDDPHHRGAYHYSSSRHARPPKWRGELYLQLHQGTLTSQALTKRLNRECENRMRLLEALLVYACFDLPALPTAGHGRAKSPESPLRGEAETQEAHMLAGTIGHAAKDEQMALIEALPSTVTVDALMEIHAKVEGLWKTILLNQFHDVLPGSSIGMVYKECNQMLQDVLSTSFSLCQQLMELLVPTTFPTTASSALVLHNAIPRELVKDVAFNGTGHDRHDYTQSGKPIVPPGQYVTGGSKFIGEVQNVPVATSTGTGAIAGSRNVTPGSMPAKLAAASAAHLINASEDVEPEVEKFIGAFAFCAHVPVSTTEPHANGGHVEHSSSDSHSHGQKVGHNSADSPQPSTFIHGERTKDGLYVMENAFVRVLLDRGGLLKSLIDKRVYPPRELVQQSGFMGTHDSHGEEADNSWWGAPSSISPSRGPTKEQKSGEGNLLCLHDDLPFFWDAWDVFPYHLQTGAPLNTADAMAAGKYGGQGVSSKARQKGKKKVTLTSSPHSGTMMKSRRASRDNEMPLFDAGSGTGMRVDPVKGETTLTVRVPLEMPDVSSMNMQHQTKKESRTTASTSTNTGTGVKAHAGQSHNNKDTGDPTEAAKARKEKKEKENPALAKLGALIGKGKHTKKRKDKVESAGTSQQVDTSSNAAAPAASATMPSADVNDASSVKSNPPSPGGSVNTAGTAASTAASTTTLNTAANAASRGAGTGQDGPSKAASLGETLMTITLKAGSPLLSFSHALSWHNRHKLLKVSFPLTLQSESCLYEIQSGVAARPTHRNTTFDDARLEVCAQRFAAIQEGNYGVALINDGKYGHSCRENVLSLSLLRSPRSPDEECDIGSHFFSYHLLPYFDGVTSINKATEDVPAMRNAATHENHPNTGSSGPAQGAGTASAESVIEAASRINSHLMKREAPMELTPALLHHLHHDLPWRPMQGPSLARLIQLPLVPVAAGLPSCHNTTAGCPLVIDAVKLAEGFDFSMCTGLPPKMLAAHKLSDREGQEAETETDKDSASASRREQEQQQERERQAYPPSCDIIVRMVEMGGRSGTAALVLHPYLLPRVERCRYVQLDESPLPGRHQVSPNSTAGKSRVDAGVGGKNRPPSTRAEAQQLPTMPVDLSGNGCFDYSIPCYTPRGATADIAASSVEAARGIEGVSDPSNPASAIHLVKRRELPDVGPVLEVVYHPYKIVTVRIELKRNVKLWK